jgi:hypothetical protein
MVEFKQSTTRSEIQAVWLKMPLQQALTVSAFFLASPPNFVIAHIDDLLRCSQTANNVNLFLEDFGFHTCTAVFLKLQLIDKGDLQSREGAIRGYKFARRSTENNINQGLGIITSQVLQIELAGLVLV